jgi:hypothetical protein
MTFSGSERVELAKYLGMTSQKAGDQYQQQSDHDPFDDDQSLDLILP